MVFGKFLQNLRFFGLGKNLGKALNGVTLFCQGAWTISYSKIRKGIFVEKIPNYIIKLILDKQKK